MTAIGEGRSDLGRGGKGRLGGGQPVGQVSVGGGGPKLDRGWLWPSSPFG